MTKRALINKKKIGMSKTEEIQYLGQMLTATAEVDKRRLRAIIERLIELIEKSSK